MDLTSHSREKLPSATASKYRQVARVPLFEKEARARMERGRPPKGVEILPQDTAKARDQAGAAVGVSGRYAIAAEALEFFEKEARERQGTRTDLGAILPGSGRARAKAGATVGVSGRPEPLSMV